MTYEIISDQDILNECVRNLAVGVILQAAREAKAGNLEARYWLSCTDVQDTWGLTAGISWSHIDKWVKDYEQKRKRKPSLATS